MKLALREQGAWRLAGLIVVLTLGGIFSTASAQDYWTGAADGNWWNVANWSGGVPTSSDDVVFVTPVPGIGPMIALGAGSVANSLWIQDDYTFTGGDLAFGSGAIRVNLGQAFVLNSQLSGTAGLTKTGGGSLRLTNALNDFTGSILLANGSLVITDSSQLGASTSAIVITESNPMIGNTEVFGFFGGSLFLDGSGGTITLARDLSIQGSGPISDRGGALVSFGDNTLSGVVRTADGLNQPAGQPRNTRLISNQGVLTFANELNVGGTTSHVTILGGVNTAGSGGQFHLTGELSGSSYLDKQGAGALFFDPSLTANFSGRLRISGSATGGQSTVRITSATDSSGNNSIFGTANGTTTSAPVDMNGGVLEIRSDSSLDFGKNVYLRASSTLFAGPGVGGSGVNETMSFGDFRFQANTTATFNSRNGYGFTFGAWTQNDSNNPNTITNNMGGTLTFTGNAWNNSDGSARILTIGGNGNTVIEGSINTSGAGTKTLTKTGTGALSILGVETTLNGPVNISGGALAITDFRSLNNNTGTINLASSSNAGTLIIGTRVAPTAAGLTTSKTINLAGTTGTARIFANQSGTNPVVLNGSFTATGSGAKTFTLGGTNTADNIIHGGIPNSSGTTTLVKVGSGTWVLAGANTYTGTTTVANGTLKLTANAATSTVLPSAAAVTFNDSNGFAGGTFELVGQDGVNNVQNLGTLTTSAGANTISLKPGTGGTASLTFGNIGTSGASTVNIVGADYTNNRVTFTLANGSVGSDGLLSRTVYWEGADFAYRQGGVMRAPVYGTDTGFVTRGTGESLGSAANNEITGSLSTNTISISTLKIAGSHTLSLNSGQTLTLSAGGLLATGGNATVTGGTLALGSQALVTRVNLETDVLTIESAVTGTGGLTKAGMGTLVLATANTRTGATNINEGTVQLSGSGTLSGANVTTTIRQNAVLDLNGVSTGTSIGQFDNTGIVTNTNAAAATLTVGNNNGTGTSYGIIDETNGVISIAKVGTGAQNWYGTSTYTGATTIGSTGLVTVDVLADIGVASGIGKGNATDDATNAASLVFDGSTGGLAYAGSLRDGFVVLGTTSTSTNRLFTLAGTGATLSSTATNNNAIVWGNTGAIVHDDEAARTLILTGTSTGDNTFNPQLTDSGTGANITSLTKTDTGQWNLGNSNNTYTGTTSVNRGILALNHNGALSDGSALVLGNDSGGTNRFGILQMSGVFERDLAGTAEAGSNTITWGTTTGTTGGGGFAAHTDQLIVAIGGLASPSNLTWGAGGFVGTNVTGTNEQALHFGSASALADVEFRNAIDLNGAVRRITVTDNPNTGADFATMTGVLSGTGGVFKDGSGALRLTGLNTYTGNTRVNAGVLAVTSLGNSADALNTPTSVGVSGIAMNDENAVLVGNASTSNAILQYIGAGETSDRKIRINATTGTSAGAQIHADGTGPLILTNVANDMVAGAKLLWLRGTNTDGNMITSQLSDNSGALSVTVDGGATWILTNGVNNYTGLTTAGGGALGIGHNNALGGELRMSNGSVFAYGGDRVIANAVSQANGVRAAFIGDYSLSFTNPYALLQTTSSTMITTNNILGDATLTFAGGVTANSLGDNSRTWTFDGNGTTIIDGTITTTQAGRGLAILKTGDGVLQLGGDYSALSGTNAFNQGNRSVEVRRGTLRMGADNVIPALAGHGGLVLSPTAATNNTAILDLNGTSQTINTLTATTDGTITITNTASGAASLTFGANNATVNFGTGAGTYAITDGVGSVSIAKVGTGVATLGGGTGATTLDYTGTTTVSGGTLNVAAALTGTTGVTVAGGATLNLFNKGADSLIGLNSLSLGVGSGTATLGFELGASTAASDRFATAGVATTANTVAFNLTNLAGFGTSSTYDLITAGSGLSGATYALGSLLPGGFTYNLNTTDTLVQLQLTAISGDLFWRGGVNNSWSGFNAGNSNFTTDLAGSTNAQAAPGALNSVIFSSTAAAGTAINTTLDNNFFVNDLKFTSNPSGVTAVTIAAGTIATNSLTIAPSFGTVGIDVANSAGNVTISAPVVIGANQTWSVASTGASLRIDGALSGTANLTKAGAGTVTLTANNGSYSGDVTISAGTVILGANTAAGSLGTGNIVNNAELIYDRTGTYDLVNTITGTGNLTLRRSTAQFTEAANLGGGNVTLATNASTTLRFIADGAANSQTVSNPISTGTGYAGTLDARGTNGASVTYAGAISVGMNANGYQLVLTGTAGSQGNITGGFTQTGTSADVNVSGGTWTLSGARSTVADDFIVSGVGAILNLNTTDVVRIMSGATSADLTIRSGAVVNINADNAVQYTDSPYRLFVGQGADGADAVLNLNANLQSGRFILGERSLTRVGIVNGTGTLTVDNAAADFIQLYRGEINANIASNGTGAGIFRKVGSGTVILRGDNSGLTNTGTTQIDDGTLVLDFTADNAAKLNGSRALDMRGATLQIIGNASADTLQTVASFTMATGAGLNVIDVTAGSGRTATLALGALTRNTGAGTLRINLNNAGAAVTTSTGNTNGIVGSAAYTTVKDGTGTWFGTNSGGNIVALASTLENSVDAWTRGDHVSDETTGFTGTVSANYLSSLRFNAAGGSSLSLAPGGVLAIGTGGILVTDQVTAGSPGIFGGTLGTGVTEIIVTQDSSQTFEISSWIGVNNAFTTTGTGTVLLSGNNVYTGGTNIQSGKLQVTGNSIGDSSLVTLASNRNSTLELLASETIGRLQGGQRNTNSDYGTVAIGSHTLTLNQTGGTTGYAGVFTGDGSIVMSAASTSTLNMTGLSTGFTGAVVVNGGLFQLSAAGRNDAASFTVNGNGMMLIDNNGSTSSTTRILDTTPIILNSAAGGGTNIRGLWVRNTDNNSSRFETIGDLVFNSGASYLTGEANVSSGNGRTGIIANDFARNDNATVSVRGRNLGTTTTHHNQFRIGTAANQTNFINALTGGGTAGSATISIVPWAIGETHNATSTGSTNMGNSLVTYVSGAGFRPLNFTDEYALYATAGATNNTRETITTDLTGLAGRTLNALVIHNNSTAASALNVTGAGAGNGLVNTSGTFLFTLNPSAAASSAHSLTLGGFDSGITVGGSEYLFFVQNPSAATTTPVLTTTIASALTSTADITKSGRGTLILSGTNTAGGGANKTTINEGVLEIAGLGNIGGSTGDLVFAGGTLRLGAGFTDDLSQRNIAFLPGGGTIDTNGIDLSLAGSLGSGAGGFTKAGAGNLTLNGAATYTGATTVAGGTLTIGANNATGSGDLSVLGGAILALGTNEISVGRVATSGASPLITGTGTITASDGFAFTNTGDITVSAILAGSGGLFKNQSSNLTLDGANTYTGRTEIQNGTLTIGSIGNVGGGGSALGNPGSVEDGVIRMGLTSSATTLAYIGSGHDSDRLVAMQGTTGGVTLNASGTGAIALGGVVGTTPGAKTLTLRGTASAALVNSTGAIHEGVATLAVIKTDANTWSLTAPNTYTGATSINQGVLRLSAVQNMAGALQFGSATSITTAGRLEVNENSTFGSLLAQTNTATANQLDIASGKSLTITGDVRIGSSLDTGSTVSNTFLTATGDGSFIVNNPAANGFFRVGGYPATGTGGTAARGNRADADFSALASMQINLDPATGIIRVNNPSGQNTTGSYATLKVAQTSSLTANQLIVGDGGQFNNGVDQINTVYLGDTANTLNINTILIGTGGRDYGAILFGGATGTVQIRAADGLGRASFNMATAGGTGTGTVNATGNTFDVTGHSADLLFDVVTIGTQNRGHNSNNTFSFDTGVLDMNSLTMAIRSANPGTGTAANWITNSTMNLGGGTVNINNGITALAQITGSLNAATTVNATLNISGGTVNIGQTGGTAVTMATASVGAANAILNLTGGNTALAGSIVRGGGAGTTTATVNLAGGSLDMTGKSIGASGAGEVTFNTQSGTLANLLELNGGGTLTKTTAGMLVMEGNNSYTGATDIVAGTLQIGSGGATGSISATSSINNAGILAFNRSGTLTIGAPIGGSGDVRQIGPGTTVLTGTNDYTGATAVNAGTLLVHGTHTGGGAYTVAGGTLGGTGSIGSVVNVNAGGRLAPGASIGTLAIVGDLTLAGGSVFEWEYDSATADLLNLNGDLNLVGGVSLDLAGPASAVPYGTTYTLISYSGAWNDGIFEGYDNNSRFFAGLNEWQIRYDDVTGGINGGMYGAFVTLTVIPEPTSVVLLLGAIMGLLLSRRRRG